MQLVTHLRTGISYAYLLVYFVDKGRNNIFSHIGILNVQTAKRYIFTICIDEVRAYKV